MNYLLLYYDTTKVRAVIEQLTTSAKSYSQLSDGLTREFKDRDKYRCKMKLYHLEILKQKPILNEINEIKTYIRIFTVYFSYYKNLYQLYTNLTFFSYQFLNPLPD